MSSFADSKTISSASKVAIVSSKVVEAIAPIVSDALIENMENENRTKKSE